MRKYDVLFVHPFYTSRYYNMYAPLGISSIGAVLKQNDFSVKAIDFNYYNGNFKQDLTTWNPKIIGIGGASPARKESFRIARISKEILPSTPIIYGGPHASFTAKDTMENVSDIDFIIKGEAEYTFLELCNKFIKNKSNDIYSLSGLCYRLDNKIHENTPKRIKDLSKLPIPARELFDYSNRAKFELFNLNSGYIVTSRGCTNACSFCVSTKLFRGGVTFRNMEQIEEEIQYLIRTKNIKALQVFDSTFNSDRNHVTNFCNMIKPYNLFWECLIRADNIDKELLTLMKNSGCRYVHVGLETINKRLREKIRKNINLEQVENVLQWCKDLDIKTKVFFTFGHLSETYEDCLDDLHYMKKNKNKIGYYGVKIGIRVYPGTDVEREMKKTGILPNTFSWAKFSPGLKNWLVLEPNDELILFQKQLNSLHLFKIIMKLFKQGTILSPDDFFRHTRLYISNIFGVFKTKFFRLKHFLQKN